MSGSERFTVRLSARYATDDDLVADLGRVAKELGVRSLTRDQYAEHGLYHPVTLHRRLGGWVVACAKAGLDTGRPDLGRSDDDWMLNILEVWQRVGRQPSYGNLRGSGFSPEGYAKRYGSWGAALTAFQAWILRQDDMAEDTPRDLPDAGPRRTTRSPNLRLRFEVLQRDRFTCVACGRSPSTTVGLVLHVDHVVPYSNGGESTADNLQALCVDCNLGKSNRQ